MVRGDFVDVFARGVKVEDVDGCSSVEDDRGVEGGEAEDARCVWREEEIEGVGRPLAGGEVVDADRVCRGAEGDHEGAVEVCETSWMVRVRAEGGGECAAVCAEEAGLGDKEHFRARLEREGRLDKGDDEAGDGAWLGDGPEAGEELKVCHGGELDEGRA